MSFPRRAWRGCPPQRGFPAAVVSASHNLFSDNGIKLFAAGGLKLPDATETAIEEELARVLESAGAASRSPVGHGVGKLWEEPDARHGYVDHLVGVLEGRDLAGMRVVVDCANGAAFTVAPEVLERLGADVRAIADVPDGSNINDGCGSTHPESLAAEVVASGAHLGLALDGDADRLLAVDHTGAVATGDELLSLFATDLAGRGKLAGNTVVVTVMTNLGFRLAMAERGITVRETQVGDRYVLEALNADGLTLGGEQSGHIVFRELATTGDGVLTGVLLLDLVKRLGAPLAELARRCMQRLPQVLHNVAAPRPADAVAAPAVQAEVAAVEAELGEHGRVLLRASGTEPLVRVMVEAENEADRPRRCRPAVCGGGEGPGAVRPRPSRARAEPRSGRDVPA